MISAEILCVGTELLMGSVVNTNAAFLGQHLAEIGMNIYRQTVVGDNPRRLAAAIEEALARCDILIMTGGLGPTYDDLTKETVAGYFGLPLMEDREALESMERFFLEIGREMTENNKKQALMPQGATIFHNANGTAPGCMVERDGKAVLLLPGPPREMAPMFMRFGMPYLQSRCQGQLVSRNLYFFGIGESALETHLGTLMQESENPTIAPYAKTGEVMLRVTARANDKAAGEALLAPTLAQIRALVGEYIYSEETEGLEHAVIAALVKKNQTLAVVESVSGSFIARRLQVADPAGNHLILALSGTDTLPRSLNLPPLLTSPDPNDAVTLAKALLTLSGADVALAVTGNLHPETLGQVGVGIATKGESVALPFRFARQGDDPAEYIRTLAAGNALNALWRTFQ